MTYKHGVYVSEVPTSILPPVRVSSAIPVVVGTAPVHRAEGDGHVNKPVLCYTYKEAVSALGMSEDWKSFTLCEFTYAFFALFNVAPMIVINVFDPATHKKDVSNESGTFVGGKLKLAKGEIIGNLSLNSESGGGGTAFTENTDFSLNRITGEVEIIEGGSLTATSSVFATYSHADPAAVTADDIVGGIDAGTGKVTGLEHVNSIFPMFGVLPGLICAPGWSHHSEVSAVMHAKAGSINGGLFKAMALVDIDSGTVTKYSDVSANKNGNNLTDEHLCVCWPKVTLGNKEFWMSTQLAGLIARTDAENDSIPYASPSNQNFQMDGMTANGEEVVLTPEQAGYLNGQGVVTALSFIGGWKCWGSRTACYPGVTDVKDAYLPVRRMFDWIGNTLVLTWWQKVDFPLNIRLVETIVDSANIWLNGLAARGFILGGRIEFLQEENPSTDLMDGNIKLHVYVTPPSPARQIDFILEYDPKYLQTLFG